MKEAVLLGSYTNTPEKEQSLIDLIHDWRRYNLPIVLSTHYPVNDYIQNLVDFYIYDKEQYLDPSIVVKPTYSCNLFHIMVNNVRPYHGPAGLIALQRAVDMIGDEFDFFYYQEYDVGLNKDKVLETVRNRYQFDYDFYTFLWHGDPVSFATNVYFFKKGAFNKLWTKIRSTQDYHDLLREANTNNVIIEALGRSLAEAKNMMSSIYVFNQRQTDELLTDFSKHKALTPVPYTYVSSIETGGAVLFAVNNTGVNLTLNIIETNLSTNEQFTNSIPLSGSIGMYYKVYNNGTKLDIIFGEVTDQYIIDGRDYNDVTFTFFDNSIVPKFK
jgi:hypothetical protein